MNDILSVDLQKLSAECADLYRETQSLAYRMHAMTEDQKSADNVKSTETVRASMVTMAQNYNAHQRMLHKKMAEMSWCTQARAHNAAVREMPRGGYLIQERLPKTYESRMFTVRTGSDGTPHLEFENTRVVCCKFTLSKDKCSVKFETSDGEASVGLPQLDDVSVFVPFRPKRVATKANRESKRARYESEEDEEDDDDSDISGDTLGSESESSEEEEEESDSEDSFIADSDEEEEAEGEEVMETPKRPRTSAERVPDAPVKAPKSSASPKFAKRIVEDEEDDEVQIVAARAPSPPTEDEINNAEIVGEHRPNTQPAAQDDAEPAPDPSATPLMRVDDDVATVENGEEDDDLDEYTIPNQCAPKPLDPHHSTQPLDIFA